jgi:hypothetical protein
MSVVDLVGRDQVAHRSQRVDLGSQPVVWLSGGPQEEVPVREPDDYHAGRERHQTAREGHPDDGAVDYPEVLAHRLEGVYGLVELHDQSMYRLYLPDIHPSAWKECCVGSTRRSEPSRGRGRPCSPSWEEFAHGEEQARKRECDEHDLVDVLFAGRQSAYEVCCPEHWVIP